MISEEQKLQIEEYLISKKLPLDILLEVKDHMILQIEECMDDTEISFKDAFSKVEISWRENFLLTTYWMFYGREKLPQIAKNIMRQKFRLLLLKSISLAVVLFGLSIILMSFVKDLKSYKLFFSIGNSIFLIIPVVLYVTNFKNKEYFSRSFKYKGQINYTFYQQNLTLLLVCFFGVSQIILEGGERLYQFFELKEEVSFVSIILLSAYRLFVYSFAIFGMLNFYEHRTTLKKLQFLN